METKVFLDFEKPIAELEEKLREMKAMTLQRGVHAPEIAKLDKKIYTLKKETFAKLTPWQKVQLSRHPNRHYTLDYIYDMANDFVELHGDRCCGCDDKAIVGGLANVEGETIMFIGHQKGRSTKERKYRNFGMAGPEGYRKALRLMRLAEKFNKPIVILIDTPGAFPGVEAEEKGQGEAIAKNLREMFSIQVPIICIIIGEGASGGALGIGIGDKVFMLQYSWYSVISPEGCASILWRSRDYKEQAAEALKLTAEDMLSFKLIDGVIEEPVGGAHDNLREMSNKLKKVIQTNLRELTKQPVDVLLNNRIEKFTSMGKVSK